MSLEKLEAAWRSDANQPSAVQTTKLMEDLMAELKRRRAWTNTITTMAGLALTIWSGRILFDVIFRPFPFDLSKEWGALALLVLPWIALIAMRARLSRQWREYPDPEQSINAMLRASLDENSAAKWRIRFMSVVLLVGAVFFGVSLYQLMLVGKMTALNVQQAGLLIGALFASILIYMAFHYFRQLKPDGERLQSLLAESSDQ